MQCYLYYHDYRQSLIITRSMNVIANNETSKWLFSIRMIYYKLYNVVEHMHEKMLRFYTTVLPVPRD